MTSLPTVLDRPTELTDADTARWRDDGYLIVRGLWSAEELAACKSRFIELNDAWWAGVTDPEERAAASDQPLKRWPRVLHPHREDALSLRMLLDPRVGAVLAALMDDEPIATQSMYYHKPPGGKGQALHQDNYYLRVRPYTCVAAWTAVDRADRDNGGLWVCPGTHTYPVQCPVLASPDESFTTDFVAPPNGTDPVPVELNPGDVLFFNGSVVHGSRPNATKDRWRRSFICHYMPASAAGIATDYHPCLRFDGSLFEADALDGGGPCGSEFTDGMKSHAWDERLAGGEQPVSSGSIPG
ncbi:MAG: phytanoyl-CoA dioxygenase family protein [Planctomycetota bacterium]